MRTSISQEMPESARICPGLPLAIMSAHLRFYSASGQIRALSGIFRQFDFRIRRRLSPSLLSYGPYKAHLINLEFERKSRFPASRPEIESSGGHEGLSYH